jgi:HSP20 family protein
MSDIVKSSERSPWEAFGDLDNFFDRFVRPMRYAAAETGSAIVPPVDVEETDHEYVVRTELPGVKKEDLDVSIQDGVLTINAETKYETEEKKGGRIIRQERRYGKYVRSLRLGTDIDSSKVRAEYKDGVLCLTLPKAEEVKPKKIAVSVK